MARMIRKQIYIEAGQQLALARTARLQGTSEAAVIRRALESAAKGGQRRPAPDLAAWQEALGFMRSLQHRGRRRARRSWRRDDLYAERLKRYERRSG